MNAMQKMARAENAATREHWGVQLAVVPMMQPAPDFNSKLVPRVMSCLRAGLGVEDMQANGTCPADEARQVIWWMRLNGSLGNFYAIRRAAQ